MEEIVKPLELMNWYVSRLAKVAAATPFTALLRKFLLFICTPSRGLVGRGPRGSSFLSKLDIAEERVFERFLLR